MEQAHVRAACLFSNEQWEHRDQQGVVCAYTRARARTQTQREDSELVSTTTGINLSAHPPPSLPLPRPHSEPTHTFMPLHPIVPHPSQRSLVKSPLRRKVFFSCQPQRAAV